jgi:WD40 repeat protein
VKGIVVKAARIAIVAGVAWVGAYGLQAQQESATPRVLRGDVARGPLAFSPSGQILVVGADGLSLQLRDAVSSELLVNMPVPKGVGRVAISPDGAMAACGRSDGRETVVLLLDMETGRVTHTLRGHTNIVQSIAFSPDGSRLASGGSDRSIRLWDTDTGDLALTLSQPGELIAGSRNLGIPGMVFAVAFSPDGALLASGGGDGVGECGELVLWELPAGRMRRSVLDAGEPQVWAVAFTPDGKHLLSGQVNGGLKVFDVPTDTIVRQWHAGGQLRSIAISPDGATLATGLRKDIRLWRLATGELAGTLPGHDNWVGSLSYSPDGKTLASASSDGVRLWDAAGEHGVHRVPIAD